MAKITSICLFLYLIFRHYYYYGWTETLLLLGTKFCTTCSFTILHFLIYAKCLDINLILFSFVFKDLYYSIVDITPVLQSKVWNLKFTVSVFNWNTIVSMMCQYSVAIYLVPKIHPYQLKELFALTFKSNRLRLLRISIIDCHGSDCLGV